MWPVLLWRAIREKNVGEKSRFSWFREFFFLFFGFGIFYFYKIGQELKIVFF